jgi:malonate-semialdehyde dehydrogenase (acetylating) / methylmalonate-semialdehyde dehydrogenase
MNAAVTTELQTIGHWIGGTTVRGDSGRSGPVYNPATGEQTGEVTFASAEEIDRAVTKATDAYTTWRHYSLSKRAELFFRIYQLFDEHRDDLARLLTAEHGKVLSDAHGEVQRGI